MPRYLERISAASRARAKRTVFFFWHSGEADRIIVASTMQTRPDNTTRALVHPEQEEEPAEKCADCRVKSAWCPGTSRRLEVRSRRRRRRRRRLLEPRHAAGIATRDYYGNRATSLIPVAASHAVRFFDKVSMHRSAGTILRSGARVAVAHSRTDKYKSYERSF